MIRRLLIAALALAPFTAHAFSVAWPIDCTLGKTCFIQNYVDHDSTSGAADFTCNGATYDGHSGTDIRLTSLAAMRAGVTVKAAADGVVLGTRNNVDDISIRDANAPNIKDRECGNGVHLQHADGFRTQYCHMQKGSIRVHTGQQVKAGDALGLVGLSGQTEFPHLHLSVFNTAGKIDPFTSTPMTTACDAKLVGTASQLWATPVPYQPTNLLADVVSDSIIDENTLLDGLETKTALATDAPAFTYATELLNLKGGDVITQSIAGPDGSMLAHKSMTLPKNKATYYMLIGKKNSAGKFAPGTYQARIQVVRGEKAVVDVSRAVDVR